MNFGKLSILMLIDIFVNEFRFINNKLLSEKKKKKKLTRPHQLN